MPVVQFTNCPIKLACYLPPTRIPNKDKTKIAPYYGRSNIAYDEGQIPLKFRFVDLVLIFEPGSG